MMTGRELVLAAIDGKTTERTPWVPFCGVHGASLLGVSAEDYLKSADLIFSGQSKAIERYKADGIPVVFDLQIEAEIFGCELNWADDNPPAAVSHPLEAGTRTLSDFSLPTVSDGRLPIALEATRRLRKAYPEVALYGLVTGPFTLALHLLGTSVFMHMFDRPGYVHEVMAFCAQVTQRVATLYAEADCDIIAVVDPMTSQIGPDQFNEFCGKPMRDVFDHIHQAGCRGSFFVCGHAQQNIEVMCGCHCDNISIDENIPLDYVRDICRRKGVSFGGNLQLTVVMLTGTPDDNRRNAIECLEIGGSQGYILAPGCDMPYATPPANVQAIAEIIHDPYAREVARELAKTQAQETCPIDMSDYGSTQKVVVDIITLDSEACAPCQYMVESVKQVVPEFAGIVEWREHKIKYRESIAFMTSLMVRNVPTICIDGQIAFVSRIPRREELIAAIQRRINEKFRTRLENQHKVIRVFGEPGETCQAVRENVKLAIRELGTDVGYQEIENPETCRAHGIFQTPAVAIVNQITKSVGKVPEVTAIKEWLKQLDE